MTLGFVLRALRRHIVLVAVVLVVGLGAAAAYPHVVTQTWTSSGQILLGSSPGSSVAPDSTEYLINRMPTYAALAETDAVLKPAAVSLGLPIEEVRRHTAVDVVASTVVLEITTTATSPAAAAALNEAVITSYIGVAPILNRRAGAPPLVIQQVQPSLVATAPDQLHGPVLYLVAGVAALTIGVATALLIDLARHRRHSAAAALQRAVDAHRTSKNGVARPGYRDPQFDLQQVGRR